MFSLVAGLLLLCDFQKCWSLKVGSLHSPSCPPLTLCLIAGSMLSPDFHLCLVALHALTFHLTFVFITGYLLFPGLQQPLSLHLDSLLSLVLCQPQHIAGSALSLLLVALEPHHRVNLFFILHFFSHHVLSSDLASLPQIFVCFILYDFLCHSKTA